MAHAFGTARPFLKWVGGKRQLLAELARRLPAELSRYHEPFVGGGALFFELAGHGKIRQASLSDTNDELINAYEVVRDHVEDLIKVLRRKRHSEREYYRIRDEEPPNAPVARAARIIYLNKTCYNGLYRVNLRGKFNVPFGRHKNPLICDAENLRACSLALRNAELRCSPFEAVLDRVRPSDFVYFDPPYDPVSRTANFAAYAAAGFGKADQERLRNVFSELCARGCNVLLSNSSTKFTRDFYAAWTVGKVRAARVVNSKATGRGAVTEIVVRNY